MTGNKLLIEYLEKLDCVRHGDFTLSSGQQSNLYINCKPALLNNYFLDVFASEIAMLPSVWTSGKLFAAVSTGGLLMMGSLLAKLSYKHEANGVYVRQVPSDHGLKNQIEGNFKKNSEVIIMDDVVTTGATILSAIDILAGSGLLVTGVICIVNRALVNPFPGLKFHSFIRC